MPLREEERLSAVALSTYLHDRLASPATWLPVNADPPDLEFSVLRHDGLLERWAVEVTGLFQYAGWEGTEVNRLAFEPKLWKMLDRFKSEHADELMLNYSLWVEGPLPIKLLNDLPKRLLEFVRSGHIGEIALDHAEAVATVSGNMNASPTDPLVEAVIRQVAHEYERIRIVAEAGQPGISLAFTVSAVAKIPNSNQMIGDIQESVTFAVNRILDAKLPKLAKLTGFNRRVLLIWSGFALAEAYEVKKALALRKLSVADVDAIFFIDFGWKQTTLVSNPALIE
jgi:hypothetical protein